MHPLHRLSVGQQRGVRRHDGSADPSAMFNLLSGPPLFERVEAALPVHRERLFPPTGTLSMFVAQGLSADGSCQHAVAEVVAKRLIGGLPLGRADTGGYCKARAHLPLTMVSTLARETGGIVAKGAAGWWPWRGRPGRLVEAATLTLPDTPANQDAYPPPSSQKPELGFPICRVAMLICLGSGALLDAAIASCQGKGSDEQVSGSTRCKPATSCSGRPTTPPTSCSPIRSRGN